MIALLSMVHTTTQFNGQFGSEGYYEKCKYKLKIYSFYEMDNFSAFLCVMQVTNHSDIFPTLRYYGVSFDNETYFCFNSTNINEIFNESNPYLGINKLLNESVGNPTDIFTDRFLNNTNENVSFTLINFTVSDIKKASHPYSLTIGMLGNLTNHYGTSFMEGFAFDIYGFISEGKVYGVISSISLLFIFYAWVELSQEVNSVSSRSTLSYASYLFHLSFDYAYALFLYNLSEYSFYFTDLYVFLYFILVTICITLAMDQITMIFEATYDFNEDNRQKLGLFFITITLGIFGSCISVSVLTSLPVLSLFYLYSFYLPQIIKIICTGRSSKKSNKFIILVAIGRLIPLAFFTMCRRNVMTTYSPTLGLAVIGWVILQLVVLLYLNNRIPQTILSAFHHESFDYSAEIPELGTECSICMMSIDDPSDCMTTPCHHSFHRECLTRWMEEQLMCPLCRARLPPCNDADL